MATGKQFRAKFYDVNGNYISDLPVSLQGFRKIINGGLGDLQLTVPLSFEESYQNAAATIMNRVVVYVGNFLLYSGFVAGITPQIDANSNYTTITCRGHGARFAFLPLKNGSTTWLYTDSTNGLKTTASASSATLDKILKAIIDRYQAEATYPIINYSSSSVASSSVGLSYIFQTNSIQDAINRTMELAPAGWYWRVGADNIFRFAQSNTTTPDIILNYRTQVTSLQDPQLIDGLINHRYFAYNGAPAASAKVTSDSSSTSAYGDWWDFKVDGNYTSATDVANANQSTVDANKTPQRRTVIEVPDNNFLHEDGYDIETFEPGQTIKLINLPEATTSKLPSTFIIAAVNYAPNSVVLELERYVDDLARAVADLELQNQQTATNETPSTYS